MEKPGNQKQLLVHIRQQGGYACSDVSVQLLLNIAMTACAILPRWLTKFENWLAICPIAEIADRLNREGQVSAKRLPYTVKIVQWISLPLSDSTCRTQEA